MLNLARNTKIEQQQKGKNSLQQFIVLSLYSAAFQGNVCVAPALIKGIFKDYTPCKLERHYQR